MIFYGDSYQTMKEETTVTIVRPISIENTRVLVSQKPQDTAQGECWLLVELKSRVNIVITGTEAYFCLTPHSNSDTFTILLGAKADAQTVETANEIIRKWVS